MHFTEWIDLHREEMTGVLQDLLAFDSVVREGENGTPFGAEVQKALDYMLHMAEQDGFVTQNFDNQCAHIEMGQGEEIIGVLTHLDIVPVGGDWDYDPFGGDVEEGRIYGRGAMDDKGPTIMVYFAMKALRETFMLDEAWPLNKKVRLILGLDEEKVSWKSIAYYLQRAEAPTAGFAPDADFPVIHAEMGILIFELVKKLEKVDQSPGVILKGIKGGTASNVVTDRCQAVISSDSGYETIKKKIQEFTEKTGHILRAKGRAKALEITAEGLSAHGAKPQEGLNAISVMLAFLGEISLKGEGINEFITFYNSNIGFDLHGTGGLGCGLEDEISGKLLFNVGLIDVNAEKASVTVCARYPVTCRGEEVYEGLREAIHSYDLGLVKHEDKKPIYFPREAKLVQTLTEVYRKYTGDQTAQPMVTGVGTYARAADNLIAFGPAMPGEPDRKHVKNEYIEIERMVLLTKIYAEAIVRLAIEPEAQAADQNIDDQGDKHLAAI